MIYFRWRFVIHGGIDGYSRKIVYLECNTNNRASKVFDAFLPAVTNQELSSRVRSIKAGESVAMAQYLLEHPERGNGRGSMITGNSVHNQRIEIYSLVVCILNYNLFYSLERSCFVYTICIRAKNITLLRKIC